MVTTTFSQKTHSTQSTCDFICGKIHKQNDPSTDTPKLHRYACLASQLPKALPNNSLVFNVEETLLKSSSWFPFFMLVAFEGGGLLRALILLILYPLIHFLDENRKLNIMVFICFFAVKRKTFRVGRTVLPKFFLENVGFEGFEVVMKFNRKVAVSKFPKVMVEGCLKEYMGIETVFARELKVLGGYYLGVMEAEEEGIKVVKNKVLGMENIIGITVSAKSIKDHIFSSCKDIYLVTTTDKEKWQYLPREKYPKPLIFHDGRLAFLPTPKASLVMFIWLPFAIVICVTRLILSISLPYKLLLPIWAVLGLGGVRSKRYSQTNNSSNKNDAKGVIYVCNHKTLLDPIYTSLGVGADLTALTYSISKSSAMLSPIKTITLTRDRDKDEKIMREMLRKGSIVICAEGTTCREPYLLRFSPLFAEVSDDIVPVALDVKCSMFYGTTASGIKALDPIFFLMNPFPYYFVNFLEKLPKSHTCTRGGLPKVEVANYVQAQIGKALGYKCTNLTRKDKYMLLAGNTGDFKM